MSVEKIISDWENQRFKPVYWLDGEEEYYINKVVDYAEHHILTESEAEFNLTVFYGSDATWADVLNACRRFPMFAERQVVLVKEAQNLKDIVKLESYFEHPLMSTILVIAYKGKKLDTRTRMAKFVKQNGEILSTKKMYDNQLPAWVLGIVKNSGFNISQKAVMLLVEHIGNDLARIENELNKITLNLKERKNITEEDIETYIGISKDFNVFELQSALAKKDLAKAICIIQYFERNPKANPIQMILPALYSFFSKVALVFGVTGGKNEIASAIGVNPFFVPEYMAAARNYGLPNTEKALILLHQYNLRSVGIDNADTSGPDLMKEMVIKMIR